MKQNLISQGEPSNTDVSLSCNPQTGSLSDTNTLTVHTPSPLQLVALIWPLYVTLEPSTPIFPFTLFPLSLTLSLSHPLSLSPSLFQHPHLPSFSPPPPISISCPLSSSIHLSIYPSLLCSLHPLFAPSLPPSHSNRSVQCSGVGGGVVGLPSGFNELLWGSD